MGERVRTMFGGVREFFGRMGRGARLALLAIVLIALGVIAALVVRSVNRPYAVLFTDLNSEDLSSVVSFLERNNVTDYRVENNNRVLVPQGQEYRLKMQIAQEGYPTSGFGYDLYLTNISSLSSDSDRNILWQADLQDRLAATIRYLDGVKSATVTIALGEDRRYILSTDDVIDASASVMVEMASGKTLTSQQADAIRLLVSHAVQGLNIDEVAIVDPNGNTYLTAESEAGATDSARLRLSLEAQENANVRNNVLRVLEEGMFGAGNVSVSVHTTVDVTRRYEDSTIYENPAWADDAASGEGIVGLRRWGNSLVRGDGDTAGGVVGTTTNADLNEYVVNQADLTGDERSIATSGEVDYNVTEHHIQTESSVGTVTDRTVAVAINSRLWTEQNIEPPNFEDLRHLVATAAGIAAEDEAAKVQIVSYPFYVEPPAQAVPETVEVLGLTLPGWVVYALIGGVVLFLVILIAVWLILRALRKRRERRRAEQLAEAAAAAEAAALEAEAARAAVTPESGAEAAVEEEAGEGAPEAGAETEEALSEQERADIVAAGADIMDIHTEKDMALRKDVRQFVEENPAVAAQMLKNWLRGGSDEDAEA